MNLIKKTFQSTTSYTYDPDGLLLEVRRPNGTRTLLTYDGAGQIETIKNPDKRGGELSFYRYAYDHSGFITKEEYAYDSAGNLVSTVSPTGAESSFRYDALDRVSMVKTPGMPELSYSYDETGSLSAVTETGREAVKEFPKEQELAEKTARLGELNALLDMDMDKKDNIVLDAEPEEEETELEKGSKDRER